MGNQLKKKNKDNNNKDKKDDKDTKEKKDGKDSSKKNKTLNINKDDTFIIDEYESYDVIDLKLLNRLNHSLKKDPIEEIMIHPKFTNSIILASRSGKIKLFQDINKNEKNKKELILFDANDRIYSMILLKNNNNNICVGLSNKILILSFDKNNLLVIEQELTDSDNHLKEVNVLELTNSNIISAGEDLFYWVKNNEKYNKSQDIIKNQKGCKYINLVEFEEYNTIFATQENTHEIYFIKYDKEKIELIKKIEQCPSIWYKGSAQKLSDHFMLLVGKFGLNVLDASNGEVTNRYIGIDRGTLLNITTDETKDNIWIVTDYYGKYFEFYRQEGNDLIILKKEELDEKEEIKWKNRLVKINNECFVAVNYYGDIFVFNMKLKYQNKNEMIKAGLQEYITT